MKKKLTPARVLVVEDQDALQTLLAYNLESAGYDVTIIGDGEEALDDARADPPEAILLDWNLPGLSGLQVCRAIRKDRALRQTPVIMVTARNAEADVIQALEAGADDYITKPFSVLQLIARLKAVMRRAYPDIVGDGIDIGDLSYDPKAVLAFHKDRKLKLSPTEFRLLGRLMAKAGKVQSREVLLDRVWGSETEADTRTVDVHIRRLRKQLTKKSEVDPIRTVRGEGYLIDLIPK
ncbi:MAG: response regulator [Alphaproteobacteria bacterium]